MVSKDKGEKIMTIRTSIEFIHYGRMNKETGSRKIQKMEYVELWSNGIPQPSFMKDSDGNLEVTLWCKGRFQKEHDGEHFVFYKVKQNVEIEIVYHIMDGDAE